MLLTKVRCLLATSLLALGVGCSSQNTTDTAEDDAISGVLSTEVLNQGITGNCWIYAGGAFVEATSGMTEGHYSIAYLSYWDWYERITATPANNQMKWWGGSWERFRMLGSRYGLMAIQSFVMDDLKDTTAAYQRIAASMKSGALATEKARKDPAIVRAELNRAFKLPAPMVRALELLFTAGRPVDLEHGATAAPPITSPEAITVRVPKPDGSLESVSLQDVFGTLNLLGNRTGRKMWQVALYPGSADAPPSADEVHAFYRRIQRVLNTGTPMPFSWFVDNARKNQFGEFKGVNAGASASIGSHQVLVTDYQVTNVPKFGTLRAGEPATDEQKQAALDPAASLEFFRVKNSWGPQPKNPQPGYNDIYADYLGAPSTTCPTDDPTVTGCIRVPGMLRAVALPPGF